MRIALVSGIGQGRTLLSSFDDALHQCGVCNYNLIPLSSIIPPRSAIVVMDQYESPLDEYGHRLYVVKAEMRSDKAGQVIAVGIGWYQWGDGRGVFVEHETAGLSRNYVEAEIASLIRNSLHDLCKFRDVPFVEEQIGSKVVITEASDQPTTALVLAVYRSEGWAVSIEGGVA